MTFYLIMTLAAWIPSIAAFESDRNDVERRMIMSASRFVVDHCAENLFAVNDAHRQRTFAVSVISFVFGG